MIPNIVQHPEKPIATDIMAAAIVEIAQGMRRMLAGRLGRNALELLIHHSTSPRVARRDIAAVLDSIADLDRAYVRNRRRTNLDRRREKKPHDGADRRSRLLLDGGRRAGDRPRA